MFEDFRTMLYEVIELRLLLHDTLLCGTLCAYVCMYACAYICSYIYIYIYTHRVREREKKMDRDCRERVRRGGGVSRSHGCEARQLKLSSFMDLGAVLLQRIMVCMI